MSHRRAAPPRCDWGWTLSIVTAGVILALDLGWWLGGEPRYLSMAVNAIVVFYLNQRDVRVTFDERAEDQP